MEIKSKSIDILEKEAEEDLKLREDRTSEDSTNTPVLFNKYHRQYRLVKTELIQSCFSMTKLRQQVWCYYSGKASIEEYNEKPLGYKIMKSDVNKFIEADDRILKLSFQIEMLEMKKKYIREKLDQINARSYHINNIIKTHYFKHGIA